MARAIAAVSFLTALLVCAAASAGDDARLAATSSPPAERAVVCGSYLNVPRESTPIASRDGRVLVWTQGDFRSPTAFIYIARSDGTGARRVVPGRLLVDSIAVAPDGGEVLVQSHVRLGSFWTLASTRVSARTSVDEREAREIRRRWRMPEWSPDGGFVAEGRIDGLWVVSADGSTQKHLVDLGPVWGAAWSPDGAQIAFAAQSDANDGWDLFVVNADGAGLRRLTETGSIVGLNWSPDGRWLASSNWSHYHQGSAIAVIRPDGSGFRYLTRPLEGPDQRSAGFVSWLSATRLVFASSERRQGRRKVAGIHTIGLDGRNERRVTYHCHLGTPANDVLRGSVLGDTLRSLAGADEVIPGPGADDVDSGPGADLIRARDGRRDLVRCGPGRDTVFADRRDVVRGCERVLRR
jgi:WD40-like Beta Propeller Repeat